jgi:6-phosphogluconolactonase
MVGEREAMMPLSKPNIHISATREQFDHDAASVIASLIQDAIDDRGRCMLVLSGGETPRGVYRLLSADAMGKSIRWDRVHVFFSDERCVPLDDPQSNFGMAQREMFSRIRIPAENIHRIHGERLPADAARAYELDLREVFGIADVVCDVVLLGIGDDGHTASLFPGTDALKVTNALVSPVVVPHLQNQRVTLTFPVLDQARALIFLVTGLKKAPVVRAILLREPEALQYPAARIHPANESIRWMLDKDAASELPPTV